MTHSLSDFLEQAIKLFASKKQIFSKILTSLEVSKSTAYMFNKTLFWTKGQLQVYNVTCQIKNPLPKRKFTSTCNEIRGQINFTFETNIGYIGLKGCNLAGVIYNQLYCPISHINGLNLSTGTYFRLFLLC